MLQKIKDNIPESILIFIGIVIFFMVATLMGGSIYDKCEVMPIKEVVGTGFLVLFSSAIAGVLVPCLIFAIFEFFKWIYETLRSGDILGEVCEKTGVLRQVIVAICLIVGVAFLGSYVAGKILYFIFCN